MIEVTQIGMRTPELWKLNHPGAWVTCKGPGVGRYIGQDNHGSIFWCFSLESVSKEFSQLPSLFLMAVDCEVCLGRWQKPQGEVICKLCQLMAFWYSFVIIILNSHNLLCDKEHWHQNCSMKLRIAELYRNKRIAKTYFWHFSSVKSDSVTFTKYHELGYRGGVLSSPNIVFLNYQHLTLPA